LVLTDIPYGAVTQKGAERAKYQGQLRKIDKGRADIETFLLNIFLKQANRLINGTIYIFCGIEQFSHIFSFFHKDTGKMTRQCGWRKTNPSPANGQHFWLNTIENCVFSKCRKQTFNADCKPSIWDFPIPKNKEHPTQKPTALFELLVSASTNRGDVVCDPCTGSGTTAIACEKLNRRWIGIEISEEYCEIAKQRIINETRQLKFKGF